MGHETRKHSILPASSCERWWNCPGSVSACKDMPSGANKYTAEGTVAHELAEKSLRTLLTTGKLGDLEKEIGQTVIKDGFEIEVTVEMIDAVYLYVDYVAEIWRQEGYPRMILEEKIELTEVNAVMFGSPDCVMVKDFHSVHVFDLKFGQGKRVSAWENKQLMYYALGVMLKEDCHSFTIHVCQPRVADGFSSFSGTSADIELFHLELREKAEAALKEKAPRVAGDHCRSTFCPARTSCPALREISQEVIAQDFNSFSVVETMSVEHILKVLKYEDTIKDWMSKVREHAKELMLSGVDIPGYKVVQSFGHAKWADPDVVVAEFEDELGDKLFEKKLISPAALEKLVGKKRLGPSFRDDYTVKPDTGYKIVEESHSEKPVKLTKAQEDFNV